MGLRCQLLCASDDTVLAMFAVDGKGDLSLWSSLVVIEVGLGQPTHLGRAAKETLVVICVVADNCVQATARGAF